MEKTLNDCILREEWHNGHHFQYFVDANTGEIIADAYKIYKISHTEHEIRKQCRANLLKVLETLFGKVFCNAKKKYEGAFF
mgnify:CR=1 FL=1